MESISSEEESRLWASGVLNIDTPKGLLHCVFFYKGICFCLGGGQEHRNLEISQLNNSTNLIDMSTVRKLQRTDLEE